MEPLTGTGRSASLQAVISATQEYDTNLASPSNRDSQPASLVDTYGYSGNSRTNALGLIQNLTKPAPKLDLRSTEIFMPPDRAGIFRKAIDQMPARDILDTMIQFFIAELNWTSQLIYPPSFLNQYESWWASMPDLRSTKTNPSVADSEFAALVLSIAALATQFMPSHEIPRASIRDSSLDSVRSTCIDVGDRLAMLSASISPRGSLFRVQHLCFTGLNMSCDGEMTKVWALLDQAVRMIHGLGYHQVSETSIEPDIDEVERELRRRVYCKLYIWDGILSRELDREPLLTQTLCGDITPRMSLSPGVDQHDFDGPDLFLERILQLQLSAFWKQHRCMSSPDEVYEPLAAEDRLDIFQKEFVNNIPAPFALDLPDRQWDGQMRWLPLQRQLLRTTVYESICQNFRPLLLLQPDEIERLPAYKQVLIETQRRTLACAALDMLEAISTLHNMLEPLQRRSIGVIVPIFEASVLLSCLCIAESQKAESRIVLASWTKLLYLDRVSANIGT